MCGRYTFYTEREIQDLEELLKDLEDELDQEKIRRGDIYPSERAPVVVAPKTPKVMTWGFPGFQGKGLIINARSETAGEKPLFRRAMAEGRCLIPATGYYEWDESKKKFLFSQPDGGLLYMAGLYRPWEGVERFVILTREAAGDARKIHSRMPVVVPKDLQEEWLLDSSAAPGIFLDASSDFIIS